MRIGTWNLAGRWSPGHHRFIQDLDCGVLLLTEVNERVSIDGYVGHLGEATMAPKRRWAGAFSRVPITPLPDPHPASALARVGDLTFCSSILPWRSCGNRPPWIGLRHVDKSTHAVEQLVGVLPRTGMVWGGDWIEGLLTIDHIAVGRAESVRSVDRHVPFVGGRHLSDHDAYVLTLAW